MFEGFTRETSDFLWDLSFNNERPWFQEHKDTYTRVLHEPFHALAEDTAALMCREYPFANFSLHVSRIYRDARRLFGRGPYKDHLWFTLANGDNRYTEGPMFWFEVSAATFGYGLGFYDVSPAEMDAFRRSVDANPARFECLASEAGKLRGFHLSGPEYKRMKKDLGPVINPWYNRKRFGLGREADFDPEKLGHDLPCTLFRAYKRLMPMYEFLYECYRSAQEQNEDQLRRIDDGRTQST